MSAPESHHGPGFVPRLDIVAFAVADGTLQVLLNQPGQPAGGEEVNNLPGETLHGPEGFVDAARRVTVTALGGHAIRPPRIEGGYAQLVPGRREPTISLGCLAITAVDDPGPYDTAAWSGVESALASEASPLGPHEHELVRINRDWLRDRAKAGLTGGSDLSVHAGLLPVEFTLRDIVVVHRALVGGRADETHIRNSASRSELLVDTQRRETAGGRPARVYRYDFGRHAKTHIR